MRGSAPPRTIRESRFEEIDKIENHDGIDLSVSVDFLERVVARDAKGKANTTLTRQPKE